MDLSLLTDPIFYIVLRVGFCGMLHLEFLASQLLRLINLGLVLMTLSVLLVSLIPSLNLFLKYGKTLNTGDAARLGSHNLFLLDLYVPKKWFTHFYLLHFALSLLNVSIMIFLRQWHSSPLQIIFLMNMIQSTRRLYECIYVSKFSPTAKIHYFHYLVGIVFYTSVNLIPFLLQILAAKTETSGHTAIPVALFLFSSYDQFFNHIALSEQKKYTLPNVGFFRYVVCPHYMDECFIYFCIFLVYPCISLFLVFFWVTVNLAISANQSYLFYRTNKDTNISNRCRIFPKIY